MSHISVLLNEILEVFRGVPLKIFVDGTLGAGGHAAEILEQHPEMEQYMGFDQDRNALHIAKEKLKQWEKKLIYVHDNFENVEKQLSQLSIHSADGILLDLGVSSMQLDIAERGFSFMRHGPLDMRMDTTQTVTAEEIVNEWSEKELGRIFRDYGEEKKWRACAQAIILARSKRRIKTTEELVNLLLPIFPRNKKGIHPLTLVFQALRISVNRELEVLEKSLPKAIKLLNPGGRLAVITFHSLEDRIVKETFRHAASDKVSTSGIAGVFLDKQPEVRLITRKPIVATAEEVQRNPRSRSAKLRVIEKI